MKHIKQPYEPTKPTKPREFCDEEKFVCNLLNEFEDYLALTELLERIERITKDKDKANFVVVRNIYYGHYDDSNSLELKEKVQVENTHYKTQLKTYEKELEKFKPAIKEYKRLKALFDMQEAKKELRKLELELEKIKSNKVANALEKQKAAALERINKLSREEVSED